MHRQTAERETRLLRGACPTRPLATDVVAVVAGRRQRAAVRGARRRAGRRGRPVDEPVHRRDPRSGRGDRRAGGDRAPEQLERHPRRRAGGRARVEARPRRADAIDPGRDRRDGRVRRSRRRRRQRGRRWKRRSPPSRPARSRPRRATSSWTASPCAKGEYLGLLEGSRSPAATASTTSRRSVVARLLAEPRSVLTVLTGDGRPGAERAPRRDRRRAPRGRDRRPGGRPAALPPAPVGRVESGVAAPGPDRPDRGQRRLSRGAAAAARRCDGDIEVAGEEPTARWRSSSAPARARRRARRLPAAGARRRRGDAGSPARLPGDRASSR